LNEFTTPKDNEQDELNLNNSKKFDTKTLNEDKRLMITRLIKDDKTIWTNILNFKKVDFKKIKELITKNGIIVENRVLKDYLDELGIISSLD